MNHQEQAAMTLVEHLTELRYRLVRCAIGLVIGSGICMYFSEHIFEIIRRPITPYLAGGGLVFTGVMDKFMALIKVGLLGGVVLTCPYWLYHIWKFVSPALYKNERRAAAAFIIGGTTLFMLGVAFVYFFVYPAAFEFLLNVGGSVDKPMITIDEYLGFFTITTLMFGLSFELPVILTLLAMIGLIDAAFLKKNRRYAILILGIIAAIITPPDAISMILMLVPMCLLYESSIWIIHFFVHKKVPGSEM